MKTDQDHQYVFREIEEIDSAILSQFFEENNLPQVTDTFTAFPLDQATALWIAQQPHQDRYYILVEGSQIIGFSMLRGFDEGFTIPSFGIIIDYRFHNLGLGKYLLTKTIEQARALKCPKVRLSVYACNLAGRKIYEASGFREIERSSIVRSGIPDEKIIMVKDLS